MVELSPVAAAVLVVAAFGALPVVGITAGQTATPTDGANATAANGTLAPGEQLAAVVGVQQAGIEGEVAERAFGQRVAAAATNTSKAGVVLDEVEQLKQRLADLRQERRELREAHRNGSISTGQYRARLARLHAESRALQRQVNTTENVTEGLPAEALEAKGINASAIRTLKSDAANLTGPEVAEIARSIAGRSVDAGVGPNDTGPPEFVTNDSVAGPGQGPPGNESVPGDGEGPPDNESVPGNDRGQPGNESAPGDSQGPPGDDSAPSDSQGPPGNDSAPGDGQGPPDDTGRNDSDPPDQADGDNAGDGNDSASDGSDNASDGDGNDSTGGSDGGQGGGGDGDGGPDNGGNGDGGNGGPEALVAPTQDR